MRILVACHCKSPINNNSSPELKLISNTHTIDNPDIYYIDYDDKCDASDIKPIQYKNWSAIPENYFNYVWLEKCPLWNKRTDTAKLIFESAYNILIDSGLVISGLLTAYDSEEEQIKFIASILDGLHETGKKYHLEIISKDELPFYLIPERNTELSCDKYFVLRKIKSGGTRKTLKNKRARKIHKLLRSKTARRSGGKN